MVRLLVLWILDFQLVICRLYEYFMFLFMCVFKVECRGVLVLYVLFFVWLLGLFLFCCVIIRDNEKFFVYVLYFLFQNGDCFVFIYYYLYLLGLLWKLIGFEGKRVRFKLENLVFYKIDCMFIYKFMCVDFFNGLNNFILLKVVLKFKFIDISYW